MTVLACVDSYRAEPRTNCLKCVPRARKSTDIVRTVNGLSFVFSAPPIGLRAINQHTPNTHTTWSTTSRTRLAHISSSTLRGPRNQTRGEGLTMGLYLVCPHILFVVVVSLGSGLILDPRRGGSVGRGARILRPDRDASRLAG